MKSQTWMIAILFVALLAFPSLGSEPKIEEITVTISGMSYTPSEIEVTKGVPVRIIFERDDEPTCGGTIVFPELGIERKLEAGETVVIELTPEKAGVLNFTCGMKMMKGKIVVQES